MAILIGDRYAIDADTYNVILKEKKTRGENSQTPGEDYWEDVGYFRTVAQACNALLQDTVRSSIRGLIESGVNFILDKVDWNNNKKSNTGDWSAATNTGNRSAATNTGYGSAATNTGNRSAATNTGERSAATNTGNRSAAAVEGKESVAMAIGCKSKARGAIGCWIVLAEWNKDNKGNYHIIDVQIAKVDGEKIKANTYYRLVDGQFVECEDEEGE